MSFSRFFIERPIFASVLSIVIVLLGGLAYLSLPVAQYPEVVPPTIVVRASYPGANAEIIAQTVATPIEQEINGVEDMLYLSSVASADGSLVVTITFRLGTDLDEAQVLVQNRVRIAEPRLPEEVRRLGVVTEKSSPDLLLVTHLVSPGGQRDQLYISNYALRLRDVIARVDGVGSVQFFGAREYSMRAWLDPDRVAALDLTAGEVVAALRAQNVQIAAGTLGQPPVPSGTAFQLIVNSQGRLMAPEEFGNVIVKAAAGNRVVRLRDVARVELGARDYVTNSYLNGAPAVAMAITQRPGSNALATAERVIETLDREAQDFPAGLEYRVVYNPTEFIAESIRAVEDTIYEAALLVVLVVVVFLQSWRSALIPLVAIPVSLIGTFAFMAVLGFSLNSLSLFGLVLAIGIVVDDAIVVVENVERHIAEGLTPREAARLAMDEVGGAVVSIALVLSAVFVPTAFISGISGQFYRQFALTIAVATLISAFNSLTLSPALAGVLLRGHGQAPDFFTRVWNRVLGGFFRLFNRGFERASDAYARAVGGTLRYSPLALGAYAALLAGTLWMFRSVPGGFIPAQDQGYVIIAMQLPDGASLERTDAVVRRASEIAVQTPGVARAVGFSGFSGATQTNAANAGAIYAALAPFQARGDAGLGAPAIVADLRERLGAIQEAFIAVLPPPPVRGIGTLGGFQLEVQDRNAQGSRALRSAVDELLAAASREPGLVGVFSLFRASSPQLYADIDRTKAEMLQVPAERVFETLQVYLGSAYVNDFNLIGRTFRVTAQADARFRLSEADVLRLRTRSDTGAMVPLGSLVSLRSVTGPEYVTRYNLFPSASVSGDTAPGFSSGQAIAALERLAQQTLPPGFGLEWTGLTYQQILAGNSALFIFPLCVLFVFLTLAAQYESWSLPLAVILIVPMCLLSAIAGVWLRGFDNNILTQIGFVVLVGLASKNAILIVEFARALEAQGRSAAEAAVEACKLRLRPILMTSFAFILGVLPLVIAEGPGAEARQALGTAVFAGMLGVTFFGLFLTPVFYVAIRRLTGARAPQAAPGTPTP